MQEIVNTNENIVEYMAYFTTAKGNKVQVLNVVFSEEGNPEYEFNEARSAEELAKMLQEEAQGKTFWQRVLGT